MSRSSDLMDEATSGLDFVQKRMFGGRGYFAAHGGIFAAIVTHDDLVLKFPMGPERDALILLGGKPWVYDGQGKAMTMQEWIVVPEPFYDDVELLRAWTLRAYRGAPVKRPKKPKTRALTHAPARGASTLRGSSPKAGLAKSSVARPPAIGSSEVKVTVSKQAPAKSRPAKTSVTKRDATKTSAAKPSATRSSGSKKAQPERQPKSRGTKAPPRRKGPS